MGNCFSSVNDDDNCRIAARERRREARRKGELQSRGGGDAVSSKEKERRVAAYLAAEQQRDGQLARLTNRGTENGFSFAGPASVMCAVMNGHGRFFQGASQVSPFPSPPGPPSLPSHSHLQSFAGPASVLCAAMDGHGRFGHTVSARVRDSLPSQLSQRLFPHTNGADATSPCDDASLCGDDGSVGVAHVAEQQWREAVRGAFEAVDREVKLHPAVDPLVSGSTAVVAMVQHDHLFLANLGDSRAVLARRAHSPASCNATSAADVAPCHAATSAKAAGTIATGPTQHQHHQSDQPSCQAPVSCHAFEAVALTAEHKCSDPTEAARIRKAGGRVEALEDEKHIMRIWLPNEMAPGLVTSRAVGDFLLKGFGVSCEPDVTVLPVEDGDEFVILATDGVWDVLSHEEAVSIVATSPSPATSAERLVTSAQEAWATKYPKARRDDCTAVVLFLRTSLPNLIPNLPCPGSGEAVGAGEGGHTGATTGTIVDTAVASTAATTAATATATATEAEAEKGTAEMAGEGSMYSDAGSDAAEQCFTERHGDAVFTDEGLRFHRNDTVANLAALDWQDEQVLAKRALRRCQGEEEEGEKKNDKQLKRGLRRGD
ncbi:unnamed protein product [Closterium sp. Naga37s-1]|nr:unnamed protein product [Closterium sp. Naga37s-1]